LVIREGVDGEADAVELAAKNTARQAATKAIEPRMTRMTRIRLDEFPIRAIRAIRGKKSS
jgi:hypothetical protein